MEHHHFDQCIMIINSQVITGGNQGYPACMCPLNLRGGGGEGSAESLRLWTCSRQKVVNLCPCSRQWAKKMYIFFVVMCSFTLEYILAWLRIQLNLSTTATVGTEESGRCREVETRVIMWVIM